MTTLSQHSSHPAGIIFCRNRIGNNSGTASIPKSCDIGYVSRRIPLAILASMMRLQKLLIIHVLFLTLIGLPKAYGQAVFDNLEEPHSVHDLAGFVGHASDQSMAAQPFELGDHDSVISATLALVRDGDPIGTMHVDLYGEDKNGNPSVSLGRLGSIEASEVDPYTGLSSELPPTNYLFDAPVTGLTPNQQYFIVLSREGSTNWQPGDLPGGVRILWSATDQQAGSNDAASPVATIPPEVPEWRLIHEDSDLPGGGPPYPVWFHTRVDAVTADFNGDGTLNASDIDLLSASIRGENNINLDPTGDDAVNHDDLEYWVTELKSTWIGDANLDGEFNTSDFVKVFQAGKYESGEVAQWSEGDWNVDGRFDSGDFVVAFQGGGYEKGARVSAATVPEPSSLMLFLFGAFFVFRNRHNADLSRTPMQR